MGNFPSVIHQRSAHAILGMETSETAGPRSKPSHKIAPRRRKRPPSVRHSARGSIHTHGKATTLEVRKSLHAEYLSNNPSMKIETVFTASTTGEANTFSDAYNPTKERKMKYTNTERDHKGNYTIKERTPRRKSDTKLETLFAAQPKPVKEQPLHARHTKGDNNALGVFDGELTEPFRKLMRKEARRLARCLGDPTIPSRLDHAIGYADFVLAESKKYNSVLNIKTEENRRGISFGMDRQTRNFDRNDVRKLLKVEDRDENRGEDRDEDRDAAVCSQCGQRRRDRDLETCEETGLQQNPDERDWTISKKSTRVEKSSSSLQSLGSSEENLVNRSTKMKPRSENFELQVADQVSEGLKPRCLEVNRCFEDERFLKSLSSVGEQSGNFPVERSVKEMVISEETDAKCEGNGGDPSSSVWESEKEKETVVEEKEEESKESILPIKETEEMDENHELELEEVVHKQEPTLLDSKLECHETLPETSVGGSNVIEEFSEIVDISVKLDCEPLAHHELCTITLTEVSSPTLNFAGVSSNSWLIPERVSSEPIALRANNADSHSIPTLKVSKQTKESKKNIKLSPLPSAKKFVPKFKSRWIRYYLRKPKKSLANTMEVLDATQGPVPACSEPRKKHFSTHRHLLNLSSKSLAAKVKDVKIAKKIVSGENKVEPSQCESVEASIKEFKEPENISAVRKTPVIANHTDARKGAHKNVRERESKAIAIKSSNISDKGRHIDTKLRNKVTEMNKDVATLGPLKSKKLFEEATRNKIPDEKAYTGCLNKPKQEVIKPKKAFTRKENMKEDVKDTANSLQPGNSKLGCHNKSSLEVVRNESPVEKPNKEVSNRVRKEDKRPRGVTRWLKKKQKSVKEISALQPDDVKEECHETPLLSTKSNNPLDKIKSSTTFTIDFDKKIPLLERTQIRWLESLRRRKENIRIRQRQAAAEIERERIEKMRIDGISNQQTCQIHSNVSDVEQIVRKIDYLDAVNYFAKRSNDSNYSNVFDRNVNDIGPIRIEIVDRTQELPFQSSRPFGFVGQAMSNFYRFTASDSVPLFGDDSKVIQTTPSIWVKDVVDDEVERATFKPQNIPKNVMGKRAELKRLSRKYCRPKMECKEVVKAMVRQDRAHKETSRGNDVAMKEVKNKKSLRHSEAMGSDNEVDNMFKPPVESISKVVQKKKSHRDSLKKTALETGGSAKECVSVLTFVGVDSDNRSSLDTDADNKKETDLDWQMASSASGSRELLVTYMKDNFTPSSSGSNISASAFWEDNYQSPDCEIVREITFVDEGRAVEQLSKAGSHIADSENSFAEENKETNQESNSVSTNNDQQENTQKKEKRRFLEKWIKFGRKK